MALFNKTIPSMVNGISQQPASLRHITQAEEQINWLSTVADGLKKRPPTEHITDVYTGTLANAYIHSYNRDITEQYIIVITSSTIKVYDLAGNEKTVTFPDGVGYLSCNDARYDFAVATVDDYTFICNKTITTAMGATTSSGSLTGTVQLFVDLPASPTTGQIYKIEGDPSNNFDSYYVQYNGSVWLEHLKPGEVVNLNASTLPHQLVRQPDGSFIFEECTYPNRAVGDYASVGEPSFIGQKISDIFFHSDRLGFSSGENIIFSRSGEYFSYFPETVTSTLDTDPIDVSVSHSKVTNIRHAIPFNQNLLLFSDSSQFTLGDEGVLTTKTAVVKQTTEFESNPYVSPVGAGQNVFFAISHGQYAGIREYFVDPDTITNDAADITAHVPKYIPDDIFKMEASSNEDILLVLAESSPNKIYVYKYYWSGTEKVQSSWSEWVLDSGDTILNASMIKNYIYILVQRSDKVYLERIDVGSGNIDADMGFLVHLDRKKYLQGTYDSGTDTTTFTLPYTEYLTSTVVCAGDMTGQIGEILNVTRASDTTYTITGDYSGGHVYVGRNYTASYTLSEQFMKSASGNSEVSVLGGKLQLRDISLRYSDTGYTFVEVTPYTRETYTTYFTGKVLGSADFITGSPSITTGTFRFPVLTNSEKVNITIKNDSYLPSNLMSLEWRGLFVQQGQR